MNKSDNQRIGNNIIKQEIAKQKSVHIIEPILKSKDCNLQQKTDKNDLTLQFDKSEKFNMDLSIKYTYSEPVVKPILKQRKGTGQTSTRANRNVRIDIEGLIN